MSDRELTKAEVVAMWLWGKEYADSGLSAIDWYAGLEPYRKRLVKEFVAEYDAAALRGGDRE